MIFNAFSLQEYAIHPAKMEAGAMEMANVIAVKAITDRDASQKVEGTRVYEGKNADVKMVVHALSTENASAHLDSMENAVKRAFLDVSSELNAINKFQINILFFQPISDFYCQERKSANEGVKMEGFVYPTRIAASVLQVSEGDFATNVRF